MVKQTIEVIEVAGVLTAAMVVGVVSIPIELIKLGTMAMLASKEKRRSSKNAKTLLPW